MTVKYALLLAVNEDGSLFVQLTNDDFVPYERVDDVAQAPLIVFVSLDDEMSIRLVDGMARSQHWVVASDDEDYFIDADDDGMPTRLEITFNNLRP